MRIQKTLEAITLTVLTGLAGCAENPIDLLKKVEREGKRTVNRVYDSRADNDVLFVPQETIISEPAAPPYVEPTTPTNTAEQHCPEPTIPTPTAETEPTYEPVTPTNTSDTEPIYVEPTVPTPTAEPEPTYVEPTTPTSTSCPEPSPVTSTCKCPDTLESVTETASVETPAPVTQTQSYQSPHSVSFSLPDGKRYEFVFDPVTYDEAKATAELRGGHLVTVSDSIEQKLLSDAFYRVARGVHNGVPVWIGLEKTNGQWQWITGEPLTYTNWFHGTGEPSGDGNYGQFEVALDTQNFEWNDIRPTVLADYIVEFEAP